MNIYRITVESAGYETLNRYVRAESKQQASGTNNRLQAIVAWQDHNAIDESENLPSVSVALVKVGSPEWQAALPVAVSTF
jgi:ribulose kinase